MIWFRVRFTQADQSQPLLLRHLEARLTFLGGARQALAVDARRVPHGRTGSVNPLALRWRTTITKPLVSTIPLSSLEV